MLFIKIIIVYSILIKNKQKKNKYEFKQKKKVVVDGPFLTVFFHVSVGFKIDLSFIQNLKLKRKY